MDPLFLLASLSLAWFTELFMDPLFLLASLSLAWFTMFFSNSSFSFSFLLPPPGLAGLVEGFTLTGLTPRSERSVAEDSSPLLFSPVFTIFEHFFGVDVEIFCWRLCEDILLLENSNSSLQLL